jgi:methyl-accepting chemotaxis protein
LDNIKKLGFNTYEQFMRVMVSAEVHARDSQVNKNRALIKNTSSTVSHDETKPLSCELAFSSIRQESSQVENVFFDYFKTLAVANKLGEEMKSKSLFFMNFSKRIKFLGLNANLSAQRLGMTGKTLSIVANQIQKTSTETIEFIENMSKNLGEAVDRIQMTEFQIGTARLLLEMLEFFSAEIISRGECQGTDQKWLEEAHLKMLDLKEGVDLICKKALDELKNLHIFIRTAESSLKTIEEVNASVGIVHVTGRTEAASASATAEFDKIFHELQDLVTRSKSEIGSLVEGMQTLQNQLSGLSALETQLDSHLGTISHEVNKISSIIEQH